MDLDNVRNKGSKGATLGKYDLEEGLKKLNIDPE
jgi:hypothetical protein